MDSLSSKRLPKCERLCGENNISTLLKRGKFINEENLKACYLTNPSLDISRIMVSVPKKLFKRAVKRNLLKRRIRESYRQQKDKLRGSNIDILFIYPQKVELSYETIFQSVGNLLETIASKHNG